MASSVSAKNSSKFNVRSISLPVRTHPTTLQVGGQLSKLESWRDLTFGLSFESVRAGLSSLEGVYMSLDGLLSMASTQQVMLTHQERFTNELLDASVQILDVCGSTREIFSHLNEKVQELRSAIRRRKGDHSCIEAGILDYNHSRKKLNKDVNRFISTLKKAQTKLEESLPILNHQDQHHSSVMRVLREVHLLSISIFQFLLSFLATPVSNPKQVRWSMITKLMYKGTIACDINGDGSNEFEQVNATLRDLQKCVSGKRICTGEKLQIANKRLEDLELCLGSLGGDLECLFRHLIRTRASLLNIISQ